MSRRVGIAIGLATALGLSGGWMALDAARASAHKSPYRLEKARVERGDVTGRVTATGTLSALVTVQVGSQVSGRISELNADFGQRVKRGQVIAKLDQRMFAAQAEQGRANREAATGDLQKARAQAEEADRKLARARALSEQNLIAKAELDAAETAAKAAKAAVAAAAGNQSQAAAGYHQAKVNLGYTTIVSPINGIVISRNVDVGQTVAASLQAPTLFTIAEDLGKMQVHAAVSEADVGRLQPGMTATFVVDAYPDRRFKGVIRQIRDAPQTLQNVVTYDAVVDVDNDDLRLKPGMTANVTFVYAERKGVLRIPSAALRFRPPDELLATGVHLGGAAGSKKHKHKLEKQAEAAGAMTTPSTSAPASAAASAMKTVWAIDGDKLREVQVEIGVSDGTKVEVRKGELAEGDVLVTDAVAKNEASGKKKGLF
ncbi:MAG TPA: efflux RND transporter periplasmic adaptor subunit [Polyangia bacterium]|nr:efflux RND transporter periplasmic adaptor subunit [Polyangia bacterium]